MSQPYVMVAPNGARRNKADHQSLPVTTGEIVATAQACHEAGANGIHVHVRDDDGRHSLDPGRYRETLDELARAVPQLRVQITTESAGVFDVPKQLHCLEQVQPAWASISVREMSLQPELADRVYGTCALQGTEIQHILYSTDDIMLLRQWQSDGIIRPYQTSVIFVLGRYSSGQTSSPLDLQPFLKEMVDRCEWMACAFGPQEHACLVETARLGGNVRVGFENSLKNSAGRTWDDNAESVRTLLAMFESEIQ